MRRLTLFFALLLIALILVLPVLSQAVKPTAPYRVNLTYGAPSNLTVRFSHIGVPNYYTVEAWSDEAKLGSRNIPSIRPTTFTGVVPGRTYYTRVAAVYGTMVLWSETESITIGKLSPYRSLR